MGDWKDEQREQGGREADLQAPAGLPPLAAGLAAHAGQGYLGFHMPGHHQGRAAWPPWRDLLGKAVFNLDLTELPGLDNLQDPQGIIRSAAIEAAAYFGAAETHFLVNGSSAGILAVLLATCREGDRVLLPRNCHQSVVHGLVLSGATPVYLPVRWSPGLGLPGMLQTGDLEAALLDPPEPAGDWSPGDRERPARTAPESAPGSSGRQQAPGSSVRSAPGRLLVLLHPSYYGLTGELAAQVKLAHHYGLPVLVDEAHGSHFCASSLFPAPALQAGADYAVHGVHKTLGAFTQAALLHCRGNAGSGQIARALRLVQTSSPSYLLLASLDVARCQLQRSGAQWEETAHLGIRLRREISQIPGLLAPGEELLEVPGVITYDPSRLVVNVHCLGITGFTASDWLRRERRILVEMADLMNLVFILTPGDLGPASDALLEGLQALAESYGFTDTRGAACGQGGGGSGGNGGYMLGSEQEGPACSGGYAAIGRSERGINAGGDSAFCGQSDSAMGNGASGWLKMMPDIYELPIPRQALTPRQAFFAPSCQVPLETAAGKVAAEMIAPYPPGIPVICPGEVINHAVLECLVAWRRAGGARPGCGCPRRPLGAGAGMIAVVDGS
ncbi:MAG: hypothetical protein ABSC17_03930 [Thermacetogeniaceae bacterium]